MTARLLALCVACAGCLVSGGADAWSQEAPPPVNVSGVLQQILVHGNYATPTDAVTSLTGLTVGQPVTPETARQVEARLRASGRFEDVEVRVRTRSLTATPDVVVIVIVREYPTADPELPLEKPPSLSRKLGGKVMFFPVLSYTDGYAFTYGARFSLVDVAGRGSRLSTPLTWGGTKQALIEFEKTAPGGIVDRLEATGGITRRTNLFYDVEDTRRMVRLELGRAVTPWWRVAGDAGLADVSFGALDDRLQTYGVTTTVDTRLDPAFPRNAVYATLRLERLVPDGWARVTRLTGEAHGYLGLPGAAVLAVGATQVRTNGPVPTYEQQQVGGADSLRGFRAGSFAGDQAFWGTAELRVPFTSPLRVARTGVAAFADVGAAYPHGMALADARFERGVGVGLYLNAPLLNARLDVAHGVGGGTRVHLGLGVKF